MNKKIYKISIVVIFLVSIVFSSYRVFGADDLSVNAKTAVIIEVNSGKIIYDKDMNVQVYPASVTKILTAILVLESCDLNDEATASRNAISSVPTGYVVAPLYVGETMKIKDLLYALLLKSSNDAAFVLAEHVGGSVEGFADMMNKKAAEIGCKNSHFVNPNGIHDNNHYTTAYDMFLISNYAMKNTLFSKIVSTYQYTLPATNKYSASDRIMKNSNYFVNPNSKYYDENVNGIKTGTTNEAGNCLITDATKNDLHIITVVLGADTADSRFSETKKMINYAFDNYIFTNLRKKGDIIKNIEVDKATKKTKSLNLIISDDITVINNINIDTSEIEPEVILNENIVAPIYKGQEVGTIKYTVDGLEYNAKLIADSDVVLKTYYVEIAVGSGVLILIICIFTIIKKKKSKKYHKRYKR